MAKQIAHHDVQKETNQHWDVLWINSKSCFKLILSNNLNQIITFNISILTVGWSCCGSTGKSISSISVNTIISANGLA